MPSLPRPSREIPAKVAAQRCIVITGASSGLGAALARAYAEAGVRLGLIARHPSRLALIAEACRLRGADVETAAIDVRDVAVLTAWLHAFDAALPVDLLVANAGVSGGTKPDGGLEEADTAREMVMTNLLGVINCVEALKPDMLARRKGQVAVVASLAAYRGLPDSPGYCASKAGVLAYGDALRASLGPLGVDVSVILPGFFQSPMSDRYKGHKLFQLSEAQAVAHVQRGLARRLARIVFPWQLALLLRLVDLLPARLGDWIIRRFTFHIAPRSEPGAPVQVEVSHAS